MITERESKIIYILKAFAIFSVVCAHISLVPDDFTYKSKIVCTWINEVGAIGVGIFFLISGWLFSKKRSCEGFKEFIKKKMKNIGIPWIISATLTYLYVAIRKGGSLTGWLKSIIGYNSSYWYLTVLMILYVAFYFIRNSKKETIYLIISCICSVISVILRRIGIINATSLGIYLNVFNWSIFFAGGYLLEKMKIHINSLLNKTFVVIFMTCVSICIIVILPLLGFKFSYFSYVYIPLEFIIAASLLGVATLLSKHVHIKLLCKLGKLSFTIYLYNDLLWSGLVVNIGNRFDFWLLLFLRPLIVIFAVIFEIYLIRKLAGLFNKTQKIDFLLGVRI